MISGSGLERLSQCAASEALPQAPRTAEEAIQGVKNHGKVEGGLVVGGDLSSQSLCVQVAMSKATAVDVEVAYAIDVEKETARVIGRRLGRNYGPLSPTEIPLTVDAVVTYESGTVAVWDWKSRKRVAPAKSNLQIRAGVIAAMKTLWLSSANGAIGYLDDGETDIATFDMFDASAFFADMRSMLNRIGAARVVVAAKGTPDVHAGPWCEYCPAMAYCPAQNRMAMQMLGELDYVQREIAFFSPEQVSNAYDLSKRIGKLLSTVDESLRLRIQQSVIPRPGGKRLTTVEMPGRMGFDKEKAIARIKELGGSTDDLMTRGKPYDQIKEIKMSAAQGVPADHE